MSSGRKESTDFPQSAGPVLSGRHPRSFGVRAETNASFSRSNTDPSGDSTLSLPHRYNKDRMTVRAVTPEPEAEYEDLEDPTLTGNVTSTPPRTPSRSTTRSASRWDLLGRSSSPELPAPSSPDRPRGIPHRTPMTATNQPADLSISRAKSRSPTRKSGATSPPDDGRYYADGNSPGTMLVHRHGYASSQSISDSQASAAAAAPVSVGYPSTQPLPNFSSSSRPLSGKKSERRHLLKPQSSITALQSAGKSYAEVPAAPAAPTSLIITDPKALLQLMGNVKGSMQGHVEYRLGSNIMWNKGYCRIDADTGSLLFQRDEHPSSGPPKAIIPDLRGCQVMTSSEDPDGIIDLSTHSSKIDMKLRPLNVKEYQPWLAAFLCWNPIKPAGARNKMVKPRQAILAREKRQRNPDTNVQGGINMIKVGKLQLWRPERPLPISAASKSSSRVKTIGMAWQTISCTLQDSGEFRLHREHDSSLLAVIRLDNLSRCAVQQLDPSILDQDHCIAIYPQYTPNPVHSNNSEPVYLGIESRMVFEVWFVLLRAFTMPEIYGPAPSMPAVSSPPGGGEDASEEAKTTHSLVDSYRIQRCLLMRIIEAKIHGGSTVNERDSLDCYAEVLLDGEVRAKTMVRTKTHNPFWREDYEFLDLPSNLTDAAVVLKQRDPRWKSKISGSVTGSAGFGGGLGGTSLLPGSRDVVIGRVDVRLAELCDGRGEMEGWMPLMSTIKEGVQERVGEMYIKSEMEELYVLMEVEYKGLSALLHRFETGLTDELARIITDLKRLADTLLQIFQASNKASGWLMSLAESEIDTTVSERDKTSTTNGTDGDSLRKAEANILFRANTILTKALDSHMRRLGREYLEETIGDHLVRVVREDVYCEVDPTKMEESEHASRNWKTLVTITRALWQAIYESPQRCPLEIRKILRHIRAYAMERLPDTKYTSVSGFLFLRFFVPAILNPRLFGLLKDHPGSRARRTLTLVAKSLQGLANMTYFGNKEQWMEPMNEFLEEHLPELKDFIDSVCSIPPELDKDVKAVPPSYAAPLTILNRLSPPSKEGFPSLPYLIDKSRALASLVEMWHKYHAAHQLRATKAHKPIELPPAVKEFDSICRSIQARVRECVEKAENAERPGSSSSLSARWEEVAEKATGTPNSSGVYTQTLSGQLKRATPPPAGEDYEQVSSVMHTPMGYHTSISTSSHSGLKSGGRGESSGSKFSGIVTGFSGFGRRSKTPKVMGPHPPPPHPAHYPQVTSD